MEGFEHPGSKQETKNPSLVGEEHFGVDHFLLLCAHHSPEEVPMPAVPAKANPLRKDLYQSLFIHRGHCSVEFAVMR